MSSTSASTNAETPDAAAAAAARPADMPSPYIGLRPYSEKEQSLFFGRGNDAKRLINKIFSSRLTLFYGPSGVGKSSLLLARVVPDLRDRRIGNSIVVIFDRWGEQAPDTAIKHQIIEALEAGPSAEDRPETLADLADRVNRSTGKSLILVLDQFEQFLIVHSERPNPLRTELAALLHAQVDVHVVISLREEFLAGLEVFAHDIVTIYDSKFRLGHLSEDGARDAIVQPAERFGVSVDPALIDRLLVDLKQHGETGTTAAIATGIELPFLQLICKGLWESRKAGEKSLSLEEYTRLGGRDGIIHRYLENLANSLPRALQQDAADVLKWLAPRSGIKQAYEPTQLAELTGIPIERVAQILAHFERNRVLRDRLVGNSHWFELYHDAYTKILTPWIEERVADKKHRMALRRWLKRAVIAAVVIGAALWPISRYISDMREAHLVEEGNIDQAIATIGRLAGDEQLAATDYHFMQSADRIWEKIFDKRNEEHRPEVAKLLKTLEARFAQPHADMAAPRAQYIRKESCLQPWAVHVVPEPKTKEIGEEKGKEAALLTISVPANMRVDRAALRCAWLQLTSEKRDAVFHLPLPRRIAIEDRPDERSMKVRLGDETWDVPLRELAEPGAGILLDKDLADHPQLAWYFEKEEYGRIQVLDWSEGKFAVVDAWIVPRWTLPLLRAAKIAVRPGEVGLAAKVEYSLTQNQKALLTRELVKLLIAKAREGVPAIVSEAEQARGGEAGIQPVLLKIHDEFAKKNKKDALRAVVASFRDILDRLGEYPACAAKEKPYTPSTDRPFGGCWDDDSAAIAVVDGLRARSANSQIAFLPRSTQQKAGRRQPDLGSRFLAADTFKTMTEYDIEEKALPDTERPLLVLYGSELAHCFVEKDGLTNQLQTGMSELRRTLFKKYGTLMPKSTWIEMKDGAGRLTVQLHGESLGESARPNARDPNCLHEVISAIGTRIDLTPSMWVSAQDVENALVRLGGNQENWLRNTYSVTDLKLLLRGVLARENATSGGFNAAMVIRDLPGLLASLPFWTQWCERPGRTETNITECLVSGFRETQRARFVEAPLSASNSDGAVDRKIGMTLVGAIEATPDAISKAYQQFASALANDAQAERREFLAAFASQILRRQARRLEQRCTLRAGSFLSDPALSDVDKVQLGDFFEAAAIAKSTEGWQALRVCQIRSLKDDKDRGLKDADLTALLNQAQRIDWKADDAAAAAILALEAIQQGRLLPDAELDAAKALIARAFRLWSGGESKIKAEAAFTEANTTCEKAQASRACRAVLKEALDAYDGPSTLIPLLLGLDLVNYFSSPSEVARALGLLSRAEMHLSEQQPEEERNRLAAWIQFTSASAYLVLARNGDRGAAEKGAELLSSLADKTKGRQRKDWPNVDATRIRLAHLAGNSKEVQAILDSIPPGDDAGIESYRMWQLVTTGQLKEARLSLERSKIDETSRLISGFMVSFVEQAPSSALKPMVEQLVANKHPYSDYVRLMLYVSAARGNEPAARQELEKRWVDIVKQKESLGGTWSSRVERGEDVPVWQEMLVGYFLGHASREDLLGWAANPEHPDAMTETPPEYRAEFHFYDAQLQSVTGDQATRKERVIRSLNEVRSGGPSDLNEYRMALYQLRILEGSR